MLLSKKKKLNKVMEKTLQSRIVKIVRENTLNPTNQPYYTVYSLSKKLKKI